MMHLKKQIILVMNLKYLLLEFYSVYMLNIYVIDPEERRNFGSHYTSEGNIMKVY